MRICELLSGRFLQKSQIYKHITHSPDNSIISVKLHFVQFGFLIRPGHGPIYDLEGREGRKPKSREERRNERHKSSGNVQENDIISVKKMLILTADFSPKWWVGTSDRTGQNSLKLVHSLLKSDHDRNRKSKVK